MRNFRLIHQGLDVAPILAELDALPEWGQYAERKERDGTAHGDMTDLWIRYFPRETLKEPADYNRPGQCVFYPVWDKLPSIHPIVWGLMGSQQSVELGGILCTRLPPGGRIRRHSDLGSWHAEHYNFKCYVTLQANARCVVECDGDEQVFRTGEIFEFDNTLPHSMSNDGNEMRTTLIICMRVMPTVPKRAPNQPVSIDIKLTDDLFVKTATVADAGTIIPTHAHKYDHVTLLAHGSMRVTAGDEMLGDYAGPAGILIPAGVKHTFTTLTPGVVFACIHALHGTDSIEIDELHTIEMED